LGAGGLDGALELKRRGRYDEAVIAFEQVLTDDPRNAYALTHLAQCQLRRGRPEQALAELDRAEAAAGVSAFSASVRGDALYRIGRYRDAAHAYGEAVALGAKGRWCLTQLGRCRLRLRDLDGAREAALRAVEREPEAPDGWLVLGDVAARRGDLAEAEGMYERAHRTRPADEYVYAQLIGARLRRLPAERRAQEVEVLLRSRGGRGGYLAQVLARVQAELGDHAAAAAAWRRGAGDDRPYAKKREGYSLMKAGDLEGAAQVLRDSLLREPHDVVLFTTYVRLQKRRGATAELEETLRELLPVAGERRGAVYGELKKLKRDGD
jgi:tetratricopeptide (TPR) repeat protein